MNTGERFVVLKRGRNALWIAGALGTLKQAISKQPLPTLPPRNSISIDLAEK